MDSYQCELCKHIYNPAKGDAGSDVEPNTPFEELPDGWVCPICGVGKDQFVNIGER